MKYYYLNEDKKPQGPYSESELLAFKESGLINDSTLAAVAGDAKWRPLGELLAAKVAPVEEECSTWNKELGNCPHCGKMIEGATTPEQCPHCQRTLHGASKGLWYAFIYALKNSFNYRGRATRTEFWGFFLFSYIISFVFEQLSGLFIQADTLRMEQAMQSAEGGNGDLSLALTALADFFTSPAVLTVQILSFVLGIALFIPQLAVTARRLHDSGHSIIGLVISFVSYLVLMITIALGGYKVFTEHAMLETADLNAIEEIFAPYVVSLIVSAFVLVMTSLYLFIMMLMPGKAGANKYGPSTLYPNK